MVRKRTSDAAPTRDVVGRQGKTPKADTAEVVYDSDTTAGSGKPALLETHAGLRNITFQAKDVLIQASFVKASRGLHCQVILHRHVTSSSPTTTAQPTSVLAPSARSGCPTPLTEQSGCSTGHQTGALLS
ncbi:MAG: hypothetical protein ACRDZR_11180 [Acidimicrobiales bacterium]